MAEMQRSTRTPGKSTSEIFLATSLKKVESNLKFRI